MELRKSLKLIYHTSITSNQRLNNETYAGDFALEYLRQILVRRNAHRRRKATKVTYLVKKNGWANASFAEIRNCGSTDNNLSSKSIPAGVKCVL